MKIKTYIVAALDLNSGGQHWSASTEYYTFTDKQEAADLFKEKVIEQICDENDKYDESELNEYLGEKEYHSEDNDIHIELSESE